MKGDVVALVQQRMGSTRLPGKAMADLAGKPLTWHVLARLCRTRTVDLVVLITPRCELQGPLVDVAAACDVPIFAPDIHDSDLAGRHYMAACALSAGRVVRVPGDNPCVDPAEVDRIVEAWQADPDRREWLWANTQSYQFSGYPDGVGAEVYHPDLLSEACKLEGEYREHPHKIFYGEHRVRTIPAPAEIHRPSLRLDVDTPEDLAFVRSIFDAVYPVKPEFTTRDVIEFLDRKEAA